MPTPDQHDDPTSVDRGDGADDFEEFGREIELIRSLTLDPVELSDAPPDLWASIAAAAGVDDDETTTTDPEGAEHSAADSEGVAPVVDLSARRRRWTTVLVSAGCPLPGSARSSRPTR
jgi:hypothetical protein